VGALVVRVVVPVYSSPRGRCRNIGSLTRFPEARPKPNNHADAPPVPYPHRQSIKTPPLSALPQQADVASSGTALAGGGGGGEPADRGDSLRNPAVAFHRNSNRHCSKTAAVNQERGSGHRPQWSVTSNAIASALGIPHHRQHHHRGGHASEGSSGAFSGDDGDSDVSVRGLLESTFPTAPGNAGGGSPPVFTPVPMNALSNTLRELRDSRNNNSAYAGFNAFAAARSPFSATMPASRGAGAGGRHARGVSTSSFESRKGGKKMFAKTTIVGSMDAANWDWRGRGGRAGDAAFASTIPGGGGGGGAARDEDAAVKVDGDGGGDGGEEWDPFAEGVNTASSTAAGEGAAAAAEEAEESAAEASNNEADPLRVAMHRAKSRRLLMAGELSGRDPREAAKLMRKNSVFVEVDERAAAGRQAARRSSHLRHLGRRNSDRGMAIQPSPSPSPTPSIFSSAGVLRRFSRAGGDGGGGSGEAENHEGEGGLGSAAAAAAREQQRRHSSVAEMAKGRNAGGDKPATSGGFAFSCDAKAQRAEISMILQRRSSGRATAGLGSSAQRRFSRRGPDAPWDVKEQDEYNEEGGEEEEEEEKDVEGGDGQGG